MRAVVTRVKYASVTIDGVEKGRIGSGLLVLLGIHNEDTQAQASWMADRICGLRIFADAEGKMNISPKDAGASILIISQFTLYADIRSRRPGFTGAAKPETAIPLYEQVIEECRDRGFHVETGQFGADMQIESLNDGPVTILISTDDPTGKQA